MALVSKGSISNSLYLLGSSWQTQKTQTKKNRLSWGGNGSVARDYSTIFNQRVSKPKEIVPQILSPANLNLEKKKDLEKKAFTPSDSTDIFRETDMVRNLTF